MTTTVTPFSLSSPSWPHCAHGADPASDPIGCRGRQVEPYSACLTHLADADRHTYFNTLTSGSDIDHRGTTISPNLLQQLLDALRDPATGRPCIGVARFDQATFPGDIEFTGTKFSGKALFGGAIFSGEAGFVKAVFSGDAGFLYATFSGTAKFSGATFAGDALFYGATISKAWFDGATFFGNAMFAGVTFESVSQLGPVVCERVFSLSGSRFGCPVSIKVAAMRLECQRTQWDSTATLQLRYATVNLTDAVLEYPLSITAQTAPFTTLLGALSEGQLAQLRQLASSDPTTRIESLTIEGVALEEGQLAGSDPRVRIESLRGTDAVHLVLNGVDLGTCLLTGTVHLDQLRLEGECPLPLAPPGLRWTARRTMAEEQHWRAAQGRSGWAAAPTGVEVVGPEVLAPVYRQLRKCFEDAKNEPDAADFYYGEMEMRRHDRNRPRAERALLALYWAVSGYGLRASRALGWLLGAMTATVLVMMLWGLPVVDPKPATTGQLTGHTISLTTDTPAPVNPSGPLRSRLTSERWEKAQRIVVNSVVFRSSGQDLTTWGTYTEMACRLTEPVLLGLAALAIRGRIKR
ncbi:pentapeptide repeat-containing protein [Actinacidiphila glaucinigra]|uniref:pentapeptide repeat-containing protein n=1 Tax=Actinacidiphila glaucinigra TaxID=235986 RepID=UPI0036E062CD